MAPSPSASASPPRLAVRVNRSPTDAAETSVARQVASPPTVVVAPPRPLTRMTISEPDGRHPSLGHPASAGSGNE